MNEFLKQPLSIIEDNENNNDLMRLQERVKQGYLPQNRDEDYSDSYAPIRFDLGDVEDDYYEPRPTQSPAVNDIFALRPPASEEDIAKTVRLLAAAFPKLSPDTWALLSYRFAALGFSKEKLNYILHVALDTDELIKEYQYDRLSVPNFVSIKRPMKLYSYDEALRRPQEMAFVYSRLAGRTPCDITTIKEAEMSGLRWERFDKYPHNY